MRVDHCVCVIELVAKVRNYLKLCQDMGIKNCKERLMDVYRKVLVCAHEASGLEMGRLLTGRCELAVTARTVVVMCCLGWG